MIRQYGSIRMFDGYIEARYLAGVLQPDGEIDTGDQDITTVTYRVRAYGNASIVLEGVRSRVPMFRGVGGIAAPVGAPCTIMWDYVTQEASAWNIPETLTFVQCANVPLPGLFRTSVRIPRELVEGGV